MKIKVIDLLVRIANGEEAPNKIRFNNIKWNRVYGEKNVCYIDEYDNDFFLHFFRNNLDFTLNDEVEIIEEPKKIEKIEMCTGGIMSFDSVENITTELKNKINELIDEINNLKEK